MRDDPPAPLSRRAAFLLAAGLACGPHGPDATATAGETGDAATQGATTTVGASSGPGATTGTEGDTTSTADTGVTTEPATSGGETGAAGCGDGVAGPGELCLRSIDPGLPWVTDMLELGDIDGDGHLDLVGLQRLPCPILPVARPAVTGATRQGRPREGSFIVTLVTALGDGDGGFVAAAELPLDAGDAALLVADVTGDGALDALLVAGETELAVLAGDGAGSFAAPALHPLPLAAVDLAAGDLDADGDLDVVAVGPAGISVLVGDGVGGFVADAFATDPGPAPVRGTLFDLDGDGALDVVFGGWDVGESELEVWRGGGDGTLAHAQSIVVPGLLVDLAVLDAAQEGRPAVLASVHEDALVLRHFPVAPDGTLGEPGSVPAGTQEQIVLGRFDGGESRDVMRVGYDRLDVIFGEQPWPPAPVTRVDGFTAAQDGPRGGDLNEDGVDDVALSTLQLLVSDP